MAKVTVRTLGTGMELAPGKSRHHWWNNAPWGKVFGLEVVLLPRAIEPSKRTYKAEITRQWRVYKRKPNILKGELEIHYIVKNIGTMTLKYEVKMATIG